MGTKAETYLLSASSGVPNILALIFFRCFLTATFMASSRSPGTLWSVRSSLEEGEKQGQCRGDANSKPRPKYLCALFFFETLCVNTS